MAAEREVNRQRRVTEWVLLTGSRTTLAMVIAAAVAVAIYALAWLGVASLGPASNVRTLLSSGLASGLLTLVTVSLSINQLLLSRVFGSPGQLLQRFEATEEFRDRTSRSAPHAFQQTDPHAFLAAVLRSLRDRSQRLEARLADHDVEDLGTPRDDDGDDLESYAASVTDYADRLLGDIDGEPGAHGTMESMTALLGPEYADNLTTGARLQDEHAETLPDEVTVELSAVRELLEAVTVFRQFLKTVAVQQDLARLSRQIASAGVVAVGVTIALTVVYRTGGSGATLSASVLRPVVSLGLGVAVTPLALLVAYMLRVATISMYTVSVGTFVPPEERFERRE